IIKELLSLSNGDYKLAYKLSERHILVEGTSRMNVKLAAQFFSNTVANAITYCGGIGLLDSFNYKDAVECIKLVNDWFDLHNTQHKYDKGLPSYGLDIEKQNELLMKMNAFCLAMRVNLNGKPSSKLLPFQKGIIISNNSLMKLYEDMKEKYDISYMTSRKLNQDVLENAFSYIKGMTESASNCITALDFKYCLRLYILGKHSTSVFSSNKNTEDGTDKNLLDENICLTGDFLQNNEDLFDETANQSELGENLALMPNESLDLLQHFEMSV
ncbi:Uncharacterized protein FWK35_00035584, partial [Aphis craccivora]